MDLQEQRFQGIVTVMDESAHRERTHALGSALGRMQAARSKRGPVGVVDPFDATAREPQYAPIAAPRAEQRRGLFSFSARARRAVDAQSFDDGGFGEHDGH